MRLRRSNVLQRGTDMPAPPWQTELNMSLIEYDLVTA